MLSVRRSAQRGYADHGWLRSFHSFSFADYYDPDNMGFGNLRVINEDRIAGGTGFGTHGHRDMEIVSYVLEGELAHKDSMGNGVARKNGAAPTESGVIRPGDVQRMTAGTGVMHSEFNHAKDQETHFLQIWILPGSRGLAPGYEQKHFDAAGKRGKLRLVASADGRDGAITLHADASLRVGLFDGDESAKLPLDPKRLGYVYVARGEIRVNGERLEVGDAAALDGEPQIELTEGKGAEVLVFDLAR
jgi:redox-sensitive bicupin YhaK (pirin superfamily)